VTRVLVADDDADILALVQMTLELDGYDVEAVGDGQAALDSVLADPPDIVLLDVMMPGLDGVEVVRRLRASGATAAVPVLLLTARGLSADRVEGLTAGADDYIVKPFDSDELLARIRTTLRRTADARSVSPLTGLPGGPRIDLEISARAARQEPFAVSHVDLDEFKSFNDAYGFLRGDALLLALCRCLQAAVATQDPPVFVGHVGGDDFVLVSTPEQAEPVCRRVVEAFDAVVRGHYDPEDLAKGHLLVTDRRGTLREHPVVTVSIGVALSRDVDRDHRAVVAAAAEMKGYAKSRPGSFVAVDRRS
jgi:diguanylate cyclase (GGDEF)-like protein